MKRLEKSKQRLEEAFTLKKNYDPFFIAEIGINHNGSMDLVHELIDLAIENDCDAVKFQKRTIDIVYPKEILDSPRISPWGKTTREQKEGLELSFEDYKNIDSYCKDKGIFWSASAWDLQSQDFLEQFDLPFYKVASAMATNLEFLQYVANGNKKTFVSTGMMNQDDVEKIIKIFKEKDTPLCLFHTVSMYPSPEDKLNLSLINKYKTKYKLPVGYSGHEVTVSPSLVAAVLGASSIERHITIDRAMYGSDQAASLAPAGLKNLLDILRKYPDLLGNGEKEFLSEELPISAKLRYWNDSN